jgi:hypothetical protein
VKILNYLYQNISYAYNIIEICSQCTDFFSTSDKQTTQSVSPPLIHLSAAKVPQLIHLGMDLVEMNGGATVVLC